MAFGDFPNLFRKKPAVQETVSHTPDEQLTYCKSFAKDVLKAVYNEQKPEDTVDIERISALIDAAEPLEIGEQETRLFSEIQNRRRIIMDIGRQVNDAPAGNDNEKAFRTKFISELTRTTEKSTNL